MSNIFIPEIGSGHKKEVMTIIKQKFSGDQQFIPSRVSFLPLAVTDVRRI
jgi:hypothetical protein